jgi:uncharacterized GH25 family protein
VSNVAKIAVPLLLLAAAAGGAAYYLHQGAPEVPIEPKVGAPTDPKPDQPEPVQPAKADPKPTEPAPTRTVASDTGNTHADAEQGVRGRVLQPNGAPAAGVPVYLLQNMLSDISKIFLISKTGQAPPPLASGATGDDGTFALGLPKLGKGVDLRIVPDAYPEWDRQQMKLLEGEWYDIGDITLEVGLTVQGRVVETHSKAAVPNAAVYMTSTHTSQLVLAAPGRERGNSVTTDQNGSFRFTNAPRIGLVNLLAEAPGYASAQLQNQIVKSDSVNDVTLELEVGQDIAGVVVDTDGKLLPGVAIAAQGHSTKTPQSANVVSDDDGRFHFTSLRPGPYQLMASSPSYSETKMPLVLTGESEVKVVMSTRGTAKLRVLAANDQAVKSYKLTLLRHFPQQPGNVAKVIDWPDRMITPADYRAWNGEWAAVRGLPAGDFVFQITENNHAKTLSPPFTIVEGGPAVEVIAKLTLGGTITGTVIDDRGQPVADAVVSTDMNGGVLMDSELGRLFQTLMPEKHTKTTTKTDGQGRFRVGRLAFAEYMIRASHPRYCEGTVANIKLESEGQVVDAGVIQLSLGALVEGVTMIGGQPTGQVQVMLSTPMTAETVPQPNERGTPPAGAARTLFNVQAQSDNNGQFRLLKRVPPGTYKATASRPGSGDNPFTKLKDLKESEKQIVIAPGQEQVTITFDLPRN